MRLILCFIVAIMFAAVVHCDQVQLSDSDVEDTVAELEENGMTNININATHVSGVYKNGTAFTRLLPEEPTGTNARIAVSLN